MISFIEGFKDGFIVFGELIVTVVNAVLLTIVYFTAIMLTSIFAKIMNHHFLNMKISKKRTSYWKTYNLNKKPKKEYYKQF